MKIIAAVIGTGIGEKHIEAINNFEKSKVKMVCEKNIKFMTKFEKEHVTKFFILEE